MELEIRATCYRCLIIAIAELDTPVALVECIPGNRGATGTGVNE